MRILFCILCCVLLSRVVVVTGDGAPVSPRDADDSCTSDVLPNTAVLLDSFKFMSLANWTTSDTAGDENRWMISDPPSPCRNTWQYCGAATSDLDTLMTIQIDPTTANGQQLTVLVEYDFFNLSMDVCSLRLSIDAAQELGTITCEDMSPQTSMYPIDSPTQLFRLRFDANFTDGACVTISRVRVYYSTLPCAMATVNYATYPMTNHNEIGMGVCVSNSVEADGPSLMLTCMDGTFTNTSSAGGCLCRTGYEATGTECRECPSGNYKSTAGNTACVVCPANSNSQPASSSCQCNAGYRRTNETDIASNCDVCAADYRRSNGMCEGCPMNSARTIEMDEATCMCQDSRVTSSGSLTTSGEACDGCISSHFLNSSSCTMCPANSMASGATDTQCTCRDSTATADGMTTTTSVPCEGCAANYRRSNGMCVVCPMFSGRTSLMDDTTCICQDNRATNSGSMTTNGDTCSACAADFYMDSGSCTPCPSNTMRMSGSAESGCSCRPGYVRMPGASSVMQCLAVVGFRQPSLTVNESTDRINIIVELSAPAMATVNIVSDITSSVGTLAPLTLVFTSGGTTVKEITVAPTDNNDAQILDPTFMITLSTATGDVMLGGSVEEMKYYQNLSVTVQDDDRTTPGPPTSVVGSALNSTAVQLTWQAPSNDGGIGVDNYTVVIYQVGVGEINRVNVNGQTLSFTVGDLQPATQYRFTVLAANMVGKSTIMNTTVTTSVTTTMTTPPAPQPTLSLTAIIGIAVGGVVVAILIVLIILICVVICRIRVNRRGFYPTYEDKASEPPTMLRYSASLRSISSQTVVPSDARMSTKENEFYV